jgi:hypothetical protein
MRHAGLRFAIFAVDDPNVDAFATTVEGRNYVLYNKRFMESMVTQAGWQWSAVAVLAHEVGHHYIGHTLDESGSRPYRELEADRFAGFIVGWQGGRWEDALPLYRALSEAGTLTHPPRSERIRYLKSGWQQALGKKGTAPERYNLISHADDGAGGYYRILVEFVKEGSQWSEYQPGRRGYEDGHRFASFLERGRDNSAIYLFDRSRTLWIRISEIDNDARLSVGHHGQGTFENLPYAWNPLDPKGWNWR